MYYAKAVEGYLGSYEYHIKKCVEIYYIEFEKNRDNFTKILDDINEDINTFERNTYLAVAMHDLGKLSDTFQNQMKKTLNKEKGIQYFRHEILSFTYMILATQDYLRLENNDFPYHFYAVLSHHKRIDINLDEFLREKIRTKTWPHLSEEQYKYGIELVLELSNMDLNLTRSLDNYRVKKEVVLKYYESLLLESTLIRLNQDKNNIRTLYSLCKGLLQYCDWIASSGNIPLQQNLKQDELIEKIKHKVELDGNVYTERLFHKKCAMTKKDVLAIAPTGSGKTEASLLWAVNLEKSRIIFLMPTMVTSNSIFDRLTKSYFKREHCGLTHSNSDVYFSINDEFEGLDSSKVRFQLLHYKAFIPPVMISTVDQLLTSGFNLGYWSLKEYSLVGSSVIFDEIQAYDTFTLGLITETIKKIKKLQGRVMIMSATMPKFLVTHFSQYLEIDYPIIATELMDRKHNKWRYIDQQIEDIIDRIKDCIDEVSIKEGKVAIIVNNIEKAKTLYNIMSSEYNVLCLHSELTMKDRMEKEEILESINDYDVIISTQVIEVSLDISFNVIFSECAPIDSLVQRAGRCNRRGEFTDSEFIVFDYSEISEKYVYRSQRDILEKSKSIVKENQRYLSEYDIAKMVDKVYEDFNMYDDNYYTAVDLYNRVASEEMIFDLKYSEDRLNTRLIDNTKISIIPYKFKDEVEELFKNKHYEKISLYEVPVSIGRYKKYILRNYCENNFNLPIYTIEYNSETGIVYDEDTYKFI